MVFGIGGSSSRSKSFVDPLQQPFLDFARNQALGIAQRNIGPAGTFSQNAGAQLFGQGLDIVSGLQSNPFLQSLQTQAGGNQDLINRQIGQLGGDLGQFFNEQLLPGIRRDANAVGALGGSRQGIAEGVAGGEVIRQFGRGVTDILGADAERSLQAAQVGGGLFSQGAGTALSLLPGLFDVGLSGFTGGFAPLLAANEIFGPPTILDKSKSKSARLGIGSG